MSDVIAKALARLESSLTTCMVQYGVDEDEDKQLTEVSLPLAALIRAAAEPRIEGHYGDCCRVCEDTHGDHAPDCALIRLCEAINGTGRDEGKV